jgi:hypothetical protein
MQHSDRTVEEAEEKQQVFASELGFWQVFAQRLRWCCNRTD